MSWWRDPVLRVMAISLGVGLALGAFIFGLWLFVWPR